MSAFICTDRHIASIATAYAALLPAPMPKPSPTN